MVQSKRFRNVLVAECSIESLNYIQENAIEATDLQATGKGKCTYMDDIKIFAKNNK